MNKTFNPPLDIPFWEFDETEIIYLKIDKDEILGNISNIPITVRNFDGSNKVKSPPYFTQVL